MKILQVLFLIFGLVIFINAQKITLSGNVTDEFGAFIPNVKIEIRNTAGYSISSITDIEGAYLIELEKGIYQIQVTGQCFQTVTLINYEIVKNLKTPLNFTLTLSPDCKTTDCPVGSEQPIETPENKISKEILQRPLEPLPKAQNKTKRKTKNN